MQNTKTRDRPRCLGLLSDFLGCGSRGLGFRPLCCALGMMCLELLCIGRRNESFGDVVWVKAFRV